MAKKDEKQLLTDRIEKNKEAMKLKEGETPSLKEVGFDMKGEKKEEIQSKHWKYLFTLQKSKRKLNINTNGKDVIHDQIKVIDFGDCVEVFTIDYTDIKPIKNKEEITYTKFDSEMLANPYLADKKKIINLPTSLSKELADNRPYIERNVVNFLDNIFLEYFNEDKGHVAFIKKSFDGLFHNKPDSLKLKVYLYKKLIAESAYRNLNLKLSFNNEPSDLIWSIYEDLISDMKETRLKIQRGNIYFTEQEKEIENLKLNRLLSHLTKIKEKY